MCVSLAEGHIYNNCACWHSEHAPALTSHPHYKKKTLKEMELRQLWAKEEERKKKKKKKKKDIHFDFTWVIITKAGWLSTAIITKHYARSFHSNSVSPVIWKAGLAVNGFYSWLICSRHIVNYLSRKLLIFFLTRCCRLVNLLYADSVPGRRIHNQLL